MSCEPFECATNANCSEVRTAEFSCTCNHGYVGNGYRSCQLEKGLEEKYIYVIVLIILLFIGLTVIVLFFLCKRRLSERTMRQPLVGATTELSPYEMKWQLSGTMSGGQIVKDLANKLAEKQDGPPPYNVLDEKKPLPPDEKTFASFHSHLEDGGRVPVHVDDDYDEVEVKDFDNPSYSTIAAVRGPTVSDEGKTADPVEDSVPSFTNPTYEADLVPVAEAEEVENVAEVDVPAMEGQLECSTESEDTGGSSQPESTIAVTFTEGERPNTVSAHVTTPDASLTINLNISLPDYTFVPINTVE